MMKKLMTVVAMVMLVVHALAESEVVDGVTWCYEIANGKATIVQGTMPCVGEMTVPETLGACPVTAIGRSAFEKKKD